MSIVPFIWLRGQLWVIAWVTELNQEDNKQADQHHISVQKGIIDASTKTNNTDGCYWEVTAKPPCNIPVYHKQIDTATADP